MSITKEQYIADHFPEVALGFKPSGNQIVVQLRRVKEKTSGGIILANEAQEFNKDNTQVGRIVAVGQIAYKHRETGEDWKEGAWAQVGDIVLIPRWGGFRFEIAQPDGAPVVIAILEDFHVKGVVESGFEIFDTLK